MPTPIPLLPPPHPVLVYVPPKLAPKVEQGRRLAHLKKKSQDSGHHENHVRNQRRVADFASPELQERWYLGMKTVLWEIDSATACIPGDLPLRFLDLGCCPGGFSAYILGKNIEATGVGISLPEADGGHSYLLEPILRPRHELVWADITSYSLGLWSRSNDGQPLPWELRSRSFDIVLLDGHVLRGNNGKKDPSRPLLLVAQLIIALQSVKLGGTIIIKLSHVTKPYTARILYLLDALSVQLTTYKPFSMHATQDTFYAIAKGIQPFGPPPLNPFLKTLSLQYTKGNILDRFRHLWDHLKGSRSQTWTPESLDFIASEWVMDNLYCGRLQQLSEHVLRAQADALEGFQKAQHAK